MCNYICRTCGTQYAASQNPPAACEICEEERQYVLPSGQFWTTLEKMRQSGKFSNIIEHKEEGIYGITTKPKFGIGQTAYVVQANGFNLLWDCITYLDEKTIYEMNK